jgi:hypothetical protein
MYLQDISAGIVFNEGIGGVYVNNSYNNGNVGSPMGSGCSNRDQRGHDTDNLFAQ